MGIVVRPRINRKTKNEVNVLEQVIIETHKHYVRVISRNGKEYDVNLSDIVKMTMNVEVGDMAIIKTFPNGWLVTSIRKKYKEPVLSEEEEKKETERQIKEFEELLGGY